MGGAGVACVIQFCDFDNFMVIKLWFKRAKNDPARKKSLYPVSNYALKCFENCRFNFFLSSRPV